MDASSLNETKGELKARIGEIDLLSASLEGQRETEQIRTVLEALKKRRTRMERELEHAAEDLLKSVVRSHKALCSVKRMKENAAYGQDPAMYYTLGVCGEAGEMANKIVKALRNGSDPKAVKKAVIKELPDVIIYSAVLAHVLDIDLTALVNEKVAVVIERAVSGYYGGPLGQRASRKRLIKRKAGAARTRTKSA